MINIQDIIPFMEKGWVYCTEYGEWRYVNYKPKMGKYGWCPTHYEFSICISSVFDIAPADDWTKSLIKVGGK